MLITDQVATAPCTDCIQERFRGAKASENLVWFAVRAVGPGCGATL